jgi:RNA-directed DNA polymerase
MHCRTKSQAIALQQTVTQRLNAVGLTVNLEKTKIVYCRDEKRTRSKTHPVSAFTFLGFDFQLGRAKGRNREYFTTFTPTEGKKGKKRLRASLRSMRLHRRVDLSLAEIARRINLLVRGWIEYYRAFRPSSLYHPLSDINSTLLRWIRGKFKVPMKKTQVLLSRLVEAQPQLFARWAFGVTR